MAEPFPHAEKAQRASASAIERMRSATSFPDFEEAWNDFLSAHSRVWTRVLEVCKANPTRATKWRGDHEAFRKSDSLLRYLKHARHSDEHAVEDAIDHEPARHSLQVPMAPEGVTYIKHLEFSIINGVPVVHRAEANVPVILGYTPGRLALVAVTNRGVRYAPPTEHLGIVLKHVDPVIVAELGVKYSAAMLEELRALIAPTP